LALFFYGDITLFNLTYFAVFIFMSFRTLQTTGRKRTRLFLIVSYLIVMGIQMAFYALVVENGQPFSKLFAVAALLMPVIIGHYVSVSKHSELYLPTLKEAATISFSQLSAFNSSAVKTLSKLDKARNSLSPDKFKKIIDDLPRHDSFRYVNSGSLTDDYFTAVNSSLNDLYLYLIISDTGTPASEIISVFTQKQFNHASLAFDARLETIVSYNGGERVYPPGLNHEMVSFFNKKLDASILVYRLPVTREQKQSAINKIYEINKDGSAYNLLGLLVGKSFKSNIMYCSQFVYSMLKHIGASYFETSGIIKPTDLIEKDYFRKLEFVEELRLNMVEMID
jgi:hypothetical protein